MALRRIKRDRESISKFIASLTDAGELGWAVGEIAQQLERVDPSHHSAAWWLRTCADEIEEALRENFN